jgi:hypothetical protein
VGIAIAMRIATTISVTISSTSVKPRALFMIRLAQEPTPGATLTRRSPRGCASRRAAPRGLRTV